MVDGIRFHSAGEARRWCDLENLQRGRKIDKLTRQVRFALRVGPTKIGEYVADFTYCEPAFSGHQIVEDFKGHDTALSRWKRKHFAAQYGFEIRITGAASLTRAA